MTNLLKIMTFFLVLAAFPSSSPAAEINRIAVIVNDEIITSYEIDKGVALLEKEAEKNPEIDSDRSKLKQTSLQRIIDKKLIYQKIRDLNIVITDEELRQTIEDVKKQNNLTQENLVSALRSQGISFEQYKSQLREQLERIRLMGQEVRSKVQVGENEMREYYDANPEKFGGEDFFRARHIFFRLPPQDAKPEDVNKVLTRAMIVHQQALSGVDFAELARKYSDDPQAAKDGGELGRFKKGDMLPEIESAVAGMKAGRISSIVNTPAGFHIIKLEERTPGEVKPFNEVKGSVAELLYKKKSEERFAQWLEELRNAAAIEIIR